MTTLFPSAGTNRQPQDGGSPSPSLPPLLPPTSRGTAALLPFLSGPESGAACVAAAMEYMTGPAAPTQGNM